MAFRGRNPEARFDIRGEDKSRAAFRSVEKGLGGFQKTFASAARVLGGVALGGGFALAGREALNFGDNLDNVSKRLGVGVEFLQEWRFAAEKVGVGSRQADIGLQRFSRRVAEARAGSGELVKTIEALGIELRNADGSARSIEAVMGDYADAIEKAETQQERLRLAFKAFDSEGAGLVSVLRDGAEGFAAWQQAARDAGAVLGADVVRVLDEAEDRLDDFNRQLATSRRELMAGLITGDTDLARRGALRGMEKVAAVAGGVVDLGASSLGMETRVGPDAAEGIRFLREMGEGKVEYPAEAPLPPLPLPPALWKDRGSTGQWGEPDRGSTGQWPAPPDMAESVGAIEGARWPEPPAARQWTIEDVETEKRRRRVERDIEEGTELRPIRDDASEKLEKRLDAVGRDIVRALERVEREVSEMTVFS